MRGNILPGVSSFLGAIQAKPSKKVLSPIPTNQGFTEFSKEIINVWCFEVFLPKYQ